MPKHKRGRPKGSIGYSGYTRMLPEPLGSVYSEYGEQKIKSIVAKEVKKEIRAGRPQATPQSMQVIGGKLRVKLAKSRTIKVGNKTISV